MSITRINTFQAGAGQGDALYALLATFVPVIEAAEGCLSCQLLQNWDDPDRLIVVEQWQSVEAHQASVTDIPPEALAEAMKLLAAPPKGVYYHAPGGP